MLEVDFDRSQPPILPPRDVWLPRYMERLANERDDQTTLEGENVGTMSLPDSLGQFTGGLILIETADYEEIING
jgi:hypothetical protein